MDPDENPKYIPVGKVVEEHAKTIEKLCDVFSEEPLNKREALNLIEKMKSQVDSLNALVEAL